MMKKWISALTALTLSVSMCSTALAAHDDLNNFLPQDSYHNNFSDLSPQAWYYPSVKACFEYGLMNGVGDRFNPTGQLTVAEALTMACRVHQRYRFDRNDLVSYQDGSPWYQIYVDYALEHSIIEEDWGNYTRKVTREEMAHIFRNALLDSALPVINQITAIPDVDLNSTYGSDIFTLYRAGVLTGKDSHGSFLPKQLIIRAEAAAILARLALPEQRVTIQTNKTPSLDAVELRDESPAVICERGILALATGLDASGEKGPVLHLYFENNTPNPVEIISADLSVNGFMVDHRFRVVLKPGEKRYAELLIPEENLRLAGIKGIRELTTLFNVMDTVSYDSWNSAAVTLETTFDGEPGGLTGTGSVLVSEFNLLVTFEGLQEGQGGMGPGLLLYAENKTGMPVALELNTFKLNGVDIGAEGHHELPGGTKKAILLQSLADYMPDGLSSTADIRSAELSFTIFETDTYTALVETGPITLDISK